MTLTALTPHPFAASFPRLAPDELQALADDIQENGLLAPVARWRDPETGEFFLLDGINRTTACELAGVEPRYVDVTGNPVAFIISANVHRRHLNTGQRAMAVAVGLGEQGKRKAGRWGRGCVPDDITEKSSVMGWKKAIQEAGAVLDHAPDLAPQVLEGALGLDKAYRQAQDRRTRGDTEVEQMKRLREQASDLASLVDEEHISLAEALQLAQDRVQKALEERKRIWVYAQEALSFLAFSGDIEARAANVASKLDPDDEEVSAARFRLAAANALAIADAMM